MNAVVKPISTDSEWTFDKIREYDAQIARVAKEFRLDTYPNQIEIITSEQMMDAYSSVGMPLNYNHWSFGKQFVQTQQQYQRGQMGLAYEIVINSDPCIAYLMEENTMMMQALVIAHACYGHNSFFKGNYLFRTWTDASAIVDYLLFAKNYIHKCEERYGIDAVEETLDSCHALMNYGVNRYKRPSPVTPEEERRRQEEREEYTQRHLNQLWNTIPKREEKVVEEQHRFPEEPQENILYFIEKNAPLLEHWQRELIRIVRKMSQYFYPQKQTQVMNEGWATFWHYNILNKLHDEGYVTDGFMMEFLHSHTSVVYQPPFDSPYFSGINPYTLGFNMFQDLRRICEHPTPEDREWFPQLVDKPWLDVVHEAMHNYKDESFILQFLSPKLIRDLKLFTILDDSEEPTLKVSAIHNDEGYHQVRQDLSASYNLGNREPNIQIYNADVRGNRSLTLRHYMHNDQPLGEYTSEVLRHLRRLWGFEVRLESVRPDDTVVSVASSDI